MTVTNGQGWKLNHSRMTCRSQQRTFELESKRCLLPVVIHRIFADGSPTCLQPKPTGTNCGSQRCKCALSNCEPGWQRRHYNIIWQQISNKLFKVQTRNQNGAKQFLLRHKGNAHLRGLFDSCQGFRKISFFQKYSEKNNLQTFFLQAFTLTDVQVTSVHPVLLIGIVEF